MNDFDDRMSRHMETQARSIDVFGGDLDAVVTRAHHRRQRRRALSVAGLVVVVGAGAAVAVNQRQDNDQAPIDAPGPEAGSAESSLQWTKLDTSATIGWSDSLAVGADGTVYALSTNPGVRPSDDEWEPAPQIMYTSADGVEWAEAGVPADLWASSLEAAGGRLYAVGTGPAGAAEDEPSELQVAASDDGGSSWTHSTLPLDVTALEERFPNEIGVGRARLAVSPSGAVLATVTVNAWLDGYTLLPDGTDTRWGVVNTATGVDVYGPPADLAAEAAEVCPETWTLQEEAPPGAGDTRAPEPPVVRPTAVGADGVFDSAGISEPSSPDDVWCVSPDSSEATSVWAGEVAGPVVRSFTWEELGVDPEVQALAGGQVKAFLATDGVNFEEVAIDAPGDGILGLVEPIATPDGFAVAVGREGKSQGPNGPYPAGTVTVLTSADGRTWAAHPAGELTGWFRSAGLMGDGLAVVLDGDTGTQLAVSRSGGPWSLTAPLDALESGPGAFVSDVVVGPLGAAAVVGITADAIADSGGVDLEGEGGYVLHIADSAGAAQLLDPSGAVVAETPSYHDSAGSPDFSFDRDRANLVVRDPATGDTLATFSVDAIDRATSETLTPLTWYIAHTVAGTSWSMEPLADLLGEEPNNAAVTMTPTNVVVRASFASPEADGPGRNVALVGTPAR